MSPVTPDYRRLSFVVHGEAQPSGSKRPMPIYRGKKGARTLTGQVIVIDANPKSAKWKERVAREAAMAWKGAPLWRCPIKLSVIFYRPRPASHFGTGKNSGRLKPSAPSHPGTKPDSLKTGRAVEDAMKGVVYSDDALICWHDIRKLYGEPARVEITVETLT